MDTALLKQPSENFYPDRLTPWMVRLVQFISPLIAHWMYKFNLMIVPESRSRLKLLKGKRLLILANHPTFADPVVVFMISAHLGEPFHYLADVQTIRGKLGPFLRRMGVYSIRRGRPDRESVRYTLELLGQTDCRLVIFPEGGCSFQNDTVMPFREGAIQMALQSLARFEKANESVLDLHVVPISIKYRYTQDVAPVIQKTLKQLEQELGITRSNTTETYQRLRVVGEQVLLRCEKDYDFPTLETPDLNARILHLKGHLLQTLEDCFDLKGVEGRPDRERVYRVQHLVEESGQNLQNNSPEEDRLPGPWKDTEGRVWTYERVRKGLWRVLNFDAIYDGYVAESPTPERYLDTLTRLEREVFGIDQPIPKGYRQARVFIGEPINLKDFLPSFQSDKTTTVNTLIQQIHQTVQTNLDYLAKF